MLRSSRMRGRGFRSSRIGGSAPQTYDARGRGSPRAMMSTDTFGRTSRGRCGMLVGVIGVAPVSLPAPPDPAWGWTIAWTGAWPVAIAIVIAAVACVRCRELRPSRRDWLVIAGGFAIAIVLRLVLGVWAPLHINGQGALWIGAAAGRPSMLVGYGREDSPGRVGSARARPPRRTLAPAVLAPQCRVGRDQCADDRHRDRGDMAKARAIGTSTHARPNWCDVPWP